MLLPVIARYRHLSIPKFFRGDAAFAVPTLYRVLKEEGYRYAIRLKANAVLERQIEHLLKRPWSSSNRTGHGKSQKIRSRFPRGGGRSVLKWATFRAWSGSRLKSYGKCRVSRIS